MQTNMLFRVSTTYNTSRERTRNAGPILSEANDIPVVIGCDTNSHHVAWGSTDTNCRGAALLEYIANSNLRLSPESENRLSI
jgi:hypothetical protein